jgi:hypothetical protein
MLPQTIKFLEDITQDYCDHMAAVDDKAPKVKITGPLTDRGLRLVALACTAAAHDTQPDEDWVWPQLLPGAGWPDMEDEFYALLAALDD